MTDTKHHDSTATNNADFPSATSQAHQTAGGKGKALGLLDIQRKPIKRRGVVVDVAGDVTKTFNVELVKNKRIRLYGTFRKYAPTGSSYENVAFDIAFEVGDNAEYDSYNYKFIGPILAIGEKTVTIIGHSKKPTRLDLYDFARRNYDFDEEKIKADNEAERQCV